MRGGFAVESCRGKGVILDLSLENSLLSPFRADWKVREFKGEISGCTESKNIFFPETG